MIADCKKGQKRLRNSAPIFKAPVPPRHWTAPTWQRQTQTEQTVSLNGNSCLQEQEWLINEGHSSLLYIYQERDCVGKLFRQGSVLALNNNAWGPRAGFGVYVVGRPQGHGLDCDVKCESEQGVTGVASGKTVPTGDDNASKNLLVTHCLPQIWPFPHKAGWNLKHKVYAVLF
ncbi:hypothetical protein INR49_021790 [Caranx melampygus]|nr:hypothetical protein INR49_021790 [Caranx melampygus]